MAGGRRYARQYRPRPGTGCRPRLLHGTVVARHTRRRGTAFAGAAADDAGAGGGELRARRGTRSARAWADGEAEDGAGQTDGSGEAADGPAEGTAGRPAAAAGGPRWLSGASYPTVDSVRLDQGGGGSCRPGPGAVILDAGPSPSSAGPGL